MEWTEGRWRGWVCHDPSLPLIFETTPLLPGPRFPALVIGWGVGVEWGMGWEWETGCGVGGYLSRHVGSFLF